MCFNTITVNFDNHEEQARLEKKCLLAGICIYEHDQDELWTDFDISGCTAKDLAELFAEV